MSLKPRTLVCVVALSACGGSTPPPKTEDTAKPEAARVQTGGGNTGGPMVEQELGSIDPKAVEKTFDRLLQGNLESCHKQGRDRIEYLSGEAKVFVRVGKDGKARYTFFDESTIGDRDTEKCVLDTLSGADWPKPQGGEAEVRSSFSWSGGSERAPSPWTPEKASGAVAEDSAAKGAIEKCKSGVSGTFRVTAYVEPGEPDPAAPADAAASEAHAGHGKGAGKKPEHKASAKPGHQHGGKFKAIGVTPPGKEGADKVDCIVDVLKSVSLPSPGSYAAKVTFTL
jgi:hypothetical protein